MSEIAPFGYEINDLTTEWLTNWMRSKNWLTDEQSVLGFSHERLGEGYGYTTIVSAVSFQLPEGVKVFKYFNFIIIMKSTVNS